MTYAEIKKKVAERYPETEAERKCAGEKRKMDFKREQLKRRLLNEQKTTCEGICEAEPEAGKEMVSAG